MTDQPSTEIELRREAARQQLVNPVTDGWTAVVRQIATLSNEIQGTEFVPKDLRDSSAKITAAILHGRELGLPPMTSLASTHIVHGRPGISAEAMRALVFQAGHEIIITESTGATCTAKGRRAGMNEWVPVTWSMAMAQAAGLPAKNPGTWKSYPRQMLQARATTELCRLLFPDVIHGLHSIEELQDLDGDDQEPVAAPEPSAPTQGVQRQRKSRRPAAKAREQVANTHTGNLREQIEIPERGRPEPEPTPEQKAETERERERQQAELRDLAEQHRADQAEGTAEPLNGQREPEAEVVDAEIVDDGEAKITKGQIGGIQAHWNRLGVTDRDQRLIYTAYFLGVDSVNSTNDLTFRQASQLMRVIERIRNNDELQQQLKTDALIPEENQ